MGPGRDRAWTGLPLGAQFQGKTGMTSANDMNAANRTYDGFISLIKYSLPIIAVIVLFVVWLIA